MNITLGRVAIVGATGPTGRNLVPELIRRGTAVRVISRSRAHLERTFADVEAEIAPADALDAAAVGEAVRDCDLVVDCIGLPPSRMDEHAATAHTLVAAAERAEARLLQVSSFWSFLPVRELPLTEIHPRHGGNRYACARREAEDVMLAAGAAVVHLPDFFGPLVHTSTLQMPLREAAAGKTMNWIGSPDTPREYVFVPDAMSIVADLALREEAYGDGWIVPGSGPLTGREAAAMAGAHLGREVKVRGAPGWLLKTLSLVSSDLRDFRPILDDYLGPIAYDATHLVNLLGPRTATPYPEAIARTLDALTS
ncbi:NAD(P)H-binding protein [bacterium]|nr:NAD(P)H-binding protein [bacterium]